MEKITEATKIVAVVFTTNYSILNSFPNVGEYDHQNILRIVPAQKINDRYFDLRTGEVVNLVGNYQVWPVVTGVVFQYPDGEQFLVTRYFNDHSLGYMQIENYEFDSLAMVRHKLPKPRMAI